MNEKLYQPEFAAPEELASYRGGQYRDQSLCLPPLRELRTSLGFIDRFLITSEAYHIPLSSFLINVILQGRRT